jgi:hypothetical protein
LKLKWDDIMKSSMLIRRRLVASLALSLLGTTAYAADWRLTEVAGSVTIAAPGSDSAAARLNQTVATGSSVTTFQGGRAVLDNGLQHIVVGPNSRMTVAPDAGGFARIIQDLGAIMFQVDKKPNPHFRVDTPLLAAVVKGTTFTVEVEAQASSVNVAEGLVEVRSNANNLGRDVPAGASGTIRRDSPASVQVISLTAGQASGPQPPVIAIEPIDYKAATKGLVENSVPAAIASVAPAITAHASGSAVRTAPVSAPAALAPAAFMQNPVGVSRGFSDHSASSGAAGSGIAVTTLASHGSGSEVRLEQTGGGRNGNSIGLTNLVRTGAGKGGSNEGSGNGAGNGNGLTVNAGGTTSAGGSKGGDGKDNGDGGAGGNANGLTVKVGVGSAQGAGGDGGGNSGNNGNNGNSGNSGSGGGNNGNNGNSGSGGGNNGNSGSGSGSGSGRSSGSGDVVSNVVTTAVAGVPATLGVAGGLLRRH